MILEGPDGAGKSTLARQLAAEVPDCELLHRGPPKDHLLTEYEQPLIDYLPGEGRNIVCDRWHLGEWVYPQVLNRESTATPVLRHHIEMFLHARGAVIVYVTQPVTTLMRRLEDRGDDLIGAKHVIRLRQLYEKAIMDTMLPVIGNGTSPGTIARIAQREELNATIVAGNGSYVGWHVPSIWLVGERTAFERPYPPAFGPYPATSGDWMLNALDTHVRRWWLHFGFANAYEENLRDHYGRLGYPQVVALGHKAHNELNKAGVPHGAVPHPQYVRRFHHREQRWYTDLIQSAALKERDLIACRP